MRSQGARHGGDVPKPVGGACHSEECEELLGSTSPRGDDGWVVVDVETSGFRPGYARVLSVAALALDPDGRVEQSVVSLVNPGVDPGPTHVHGITADMLEDQPTFADIAKDLSELVHGRTLVAHNAGFDHSFLVAEAELARTALPVDTVMCTVELARRLDLGLENLRLETLARHWESRRRAPTTPSDDALVLSRVLTPALQRARERDVAAGAAGDPAVLAQRSGHPRRTQAIEDARLADGLPISEPGPVPAGWSAGPGHASGALGRGEPYPRGTRRTNPARGLAYADAVDPETSLVICNETAPDHGKGFQARELGVPTVSDEQFMRRVAAVTGGIGVETFEPSVDQGQQFALF